MNCSVLHCVKGELTPEERRVMFHSHFPSDEIMCQKWLDIIKNEKLKRFSLAELPKKNYYICSRHFEQKYIKPAPYPGYRKKRLHPNAIPTLHLEDEYLKKFKEAVEKRKLALSAKGKDATSENTQQIETAADIFLKFNPTENELIDSNSEKENTNLGSNLYLQNEDRAIILEKLDHTIHNYSENTSKLKDLDKEPNFTTTKLEKVDPNKTVVIDYVDERIVWRYVNKSEIQTTDETVVIEDVRTSKCCVCLHINIDLISFYQMDEEDTYFSKMKATFPDLEFDYGDLKNLICTSCVESLNSAYKFRLKILEAQKILNQVPKNDRQIEKQDECEPATNEISRNIYNRAIENLRKSVLGSQQKQHITILRKRSKIKDIMSVLEGTKITQCKDNPLIETVAKPKKYIYGCNFCSLKFNDLMPLYHHKVFNHGQDMYRCQVSGKLRSRRSQQTSLENVQSSSSILEGLLKKGKKKITEESKPFMQCPKCPKKFKSDLVFRRHQKWHDGIKEFCCEKCGKMFLKIERLKIHMDTHLEIPKYACSFCGKPFKAKSNLKHHELTHGEATIMCQICGKCVYSKIQLSNHLLIHSEERPYACTTCSARFKRKNDLLIHTRTHLKEKPYKCDQCQLSFSILNSLKVHLIKVHLKIKNSTCHICDKKFYTKNYLKRHMLTHEITRKTCPLCDKVIKHNESLYRHKKVVHENAKRHECSTCGKKFRDNTGLQYHIEHNYCSKNSSGAQTTQYQCRICNFKNFRREQKLKMHVEKFHKSTSNQDKVEN